jgi:hypothetical protein
MVRRLLVSVGVLLSRRCAARQPAILSTPSPTPTPTSLALAPSMIVALGPPVSPMPGISGDASFHKVVGGSASRGVFCRARAVRLWVERRCQGPQRLRPRPQGQDIPKLVTRAPQQQAAGRHTPARTCRCPTGRPPSRMDSSGPCAPQRSAPTERSFRSRAGNATGRADFGLSDHSGLLGQGVCSSLSARSTLSA